jgi:hypothetical protein
MPDRLDREQQRIVREYLATGGVADRHWTMWDEPTLTACMRAADDALRNALVAEVKRKAKGSRSPHPAPPSDFVQLTRQRVGPMVRGLFPTREQQVILGLLENSVVFVTTSKIEHLLRVEPFFW